MFFSFVLAHCAFLGVVRRAPRAGHQPEPANHPPGHPASSFCDTCLHMRKGRPTTKRSDLTRVPYIGLDFGSRFLVMCGIARGEGRPAWMSRRAPRDGTSLRCAASCFHRCLSPASPRDGASCWACCALRELVVAPRSAPARSGRACLCDASARPLDRSAPANPLRVPVLSGPCLAVRSVPALQDLYRIFCRWRSRLHPTS